MPARTTTRDGQKWCNGPCGRRLPVGRFYGSRRGVLQSTCKDCHRTAQRLRYRDKYGTDQSFRVRERIRCLAAYHARRASEAA